MLATVRMAHLDIARGQLGSLRDRITPRQCTTLTTEISDLKIFSSMRFLLALLVP